MANEVCKEGDATPIILLGVSVLAWEHRFVTSFFELWNDLMTYSGKGRKFQIGYKFAYRRPVQFAQHEIVEHAVNCGATHVVLMDDDIYNVKASDILTLLDADKDIIGGIMPVGGMPYTLCCFRRCDTSTTLGEQSQLKTPARLYEIPEQDRHGIQPVDLLSFGCIMIKTRVFKDMPKPYFRCDLNAPTDSYFMDDVIARGFQPYVHFGVMLNHRGVTAYNRHLYSQIDQVNAQQNTLENAVLLTPEEMVRHSVYMQMKIDEAERKLKEKNTKDQKFYQKDETCPIAKEVIKEDSNVTKETVS